MESEGRKLHLVMPMAGRGSRFSKDGFDLPKPLIPIQGKPFFWWAVRSVTAFVPTEDVSFVVLREHAEDFHIDGAIKEYFPEARVTVLPEVTAGAAVTALKGAEGLPQNEAVLFNDCDHLFKSSAFADFIRGEGAVPDGALLTFKSDSPAYSYMEYGPAGEVIGTVEKKVVSNDAICGAYYFKSAGEYASACEKYLNDCAYAEFFLSGVYNTMLKEGKTLKSFGTDYHLPYGTPEEYAAAESAENLQYFRELSHD